MTYSIDFKLVNVLLLAFLLLQAIDSTTGDSTEPFARFEFKLSFKGPYLVQKDGTIPFWEFGGHAIAGDSYLRLTPSMSDKKGYAWSKKLGEFKNFRIDVALKVSGRSRFGGDGMAVWYVRDKPDPNLDSLEVFGSKNNWTGLGVLFDSYDNDNKHDNPKIAGFVGPDGGLAWKHETDGLGQDVGHCLRDYRNRPAPVRVRIEYLRRRLRVSVNNGVSSEDVADDYEECFHRDDVDLPPKGYFGVTAATGGVSDDMDVLSFVVHSLTDKGQAEKEGPSDADRKKYEEEYEEYSKKLKEQIEAIAKSHQKASEGAPQAQGEEKEDEAARQFRQVWEEQSHIRSLLHSVSAAVTDARQELVTGVNALTRSVESLRKEAAAAAKKGGSAPAADSYALKELKESVGRLADKMDHLATRHSELATRVEARAADAGTAPQCASQFGVYCALLAQTAALGALAFAYFKRQEAAKKFY